MTAGYFIAALPVTFLGSMAVRPALGRRSGTIAKLASSYVIMPVAAFCAAVRIDLATGPSVLAGALLAWIAFGVAALLVIVAGRLLRWSRDTVCCLIVTAGLANTAMLGYPLVTLAHGPLALGPAVLLDQLGSFLALSTAGLLVLQWGASGSMAALPMLKRVATFPPFVALLGGLALNRLGLALPGEALALGSFASRSVAIAGLVALGLGADFGAVHDLGEELAVGLAVKLVAVPAVALAAAFALGLRAPAVPLQLAAPSLMSGAVLSARYGLNPPLASLMPTFGLLPALLSVPAWWWLSHWVLR